jgi:hypothetical protein
MAKKGRGMLTRAHRGTFALKGCAGGVQPVNVAAPHIRPQDIPRTDCVWVDAAIVAALAERGDAVNDRVYKVRFDGTVICSIDRIGLLGAGRLWACFAGLRRLGDTQLSRVAGNRKGRPGGRPFCSSLDGKCRGLLRGKHCGLRLAPANRRIAETDEA